MKIPDVADAVALAAKVHRGAVDKAGAPYILQPLRVMMAMTTDEGRRVAVLHDVLEDTKITVAELRRRGYPAREIEALRALTRRKRESYEAFIERVAQNPLAAEVKRAELQDNLDVRRLVEVTEDDAIRLTKYLRAWRRLSGESVMPAEDDRRHGKGHDSVFMELPDGTRTNAFLYDIVDSVPDTPADRRAYRKMLIEMGLTEEEAKVIS